MPGIAGHIALGQSGHNPTLLGQMLQPLAHETFYRSGRHSEPQLRFDLGWTSLPGASSEHAIWNEARDVGFILAGEPLVDASVRHGLAAKGHAFQSGDASYIVHLYEERGLDFLQALDGWFSGIIIDKRQNDIVLFNDRQGLGRIYFHQANDRFYFATEAKAILAVVPSLRALNPRGLGEMLSCGCALQDRSIFQGISLLPKGSAWHLNSAGIRRAQYFTPAQWESQPKLTSAEYYQELREIFPSVLPKYLESSQRVGMSLTGGLDGRMIMAWAKCPPKTLPCYTFGSMFRECTDATLARRVAEVCGQPHQIIPVAEEFFPHFATLAEKAVYVSDGALDVSASVELYVNGFAREIAPVRLTGNYGSEILRGNVAFKPFQHSHEILAPEVVAAMATAAQTYSQEAACDPVSFIAFKQVPWHHYSRLAVEQSQLTLRSPYLDQRLVKLMFRAPTDAIRDKSHSLRVIAEGDRALAAIPTDRGLLLHPRPVLSKITHVYQEMIFKAEYAYDYGMPDWVSRVDSAFSWLQLERLFLGQHKFYHFRSWYKGKLSGAVKEILLDPQTLSRSFFQRKELERCVEDHMRGRRNLTMTLHTALWLELIHRKLIASWGSVARAA
jgi:asparagine synthase (glutamine-hydrolysing)